MSCPRGARPEASSSPTKFVQSVGTNTIGAVQVLVNGTNLPQAAGGGVNLVPTAINNGVVGAWLCGPSTNNTSLSKYLPGSCRDTTVFSQAGFATF